MLLRYPHGFIRRYYSVFERLLVAVALAVLVYGLARALPFYPRYWDEVIALVVFAGALWSPALGFSLATMAAIYPLYQFSIYILALFLIIALLGHRLFIDNLGATVLILAAPWLAPLYLVWTVPILGGLWWGAAGGALIGAAAALWGQLLAGLTGLPPDWIWHLDLAPQVSRLPALFGQVDSIETFSLLLYPLAPDSTTLLYHLMQVLLWAAVGALTGAAADHPRLQKFEPWSYMLLGVAAAAALPGGHLALAFWLGRLTQADLMNVGLALFFSAGAAAIAVAVLETFRDILERPLPQTSASFRERLAARAPQPNKTPLAQREQPAQAGAVSRPTQEAEQSSAKPPGEDGDDADDLIMLELD